MPRGGPNQGGVRWRSSGSRCCGGGGSKDQLIRDGLNDTVAIRNTYSPVRPSGVIAPRSLAASHRTIPNTTANGSRPRCRLLLLPPSGSSGLYAHRVRDPLAKAVPDPHEFAPLRVDAFSNTASFPTASSGAVLMENPKLAIGRNARCGAPPASLINAGYAPRRRQDLALTAHPGTSWPALPFDVNYMPRHARAVSHGGAPAVRPRKQRFDRSGAGAQAGSAGSHASNSPTRPHSSVVPQAEP